jgi:hypothetical protein
MDVNTHACILLSTSGDCMADDLYHVESLADISKI